MRLPERVGVYGGGRMGAGIAQAFAVAGSSVIVVESDEVAAAAARERIETGLGRAVAKGAVVGGAFEVVTRPALLAECELVIEAVPELIALKLEVLARITVAVPEAAIASNTSSLSIDALADAVAEPGRVIGLHFFNPVPVSELVEVVVGPRTDTGLVTRAVGWVGAIGKTAITVRDSPGFASSRLGVALGLEAIRMLEEGVASAEDIDTAMTLGYRHAVGPLRTTDLVGLDVRLAVAEHLERELGPRYAPPKLLRDKVAAGELGRKTGRGFYSW